MSELSGVWVVYDYDHLPYVLSIHQAAEEAARAAAKQGYGRIGRVPFGADFNDALREWEGR